MKKYIKNDRILNILKVKYRGKYGKIDKIWQNFNNKIYIGKKDKNDKILIILKLKYREKKWKWQNSKYKLEGTKVEKKYF